MDTNFVFTRQKAQQLARAAKKKGILIPQPCERCGSTLLIHMHHDDYSKPLDVRWFCDSHHFHLHKTLKIPNIYSQVFNIRDMPPDLHARVKHAATDQKTSMEKLILAAIEKAFPAPRMVQPLQKGGK